MFDWNNFLPSSGEEERVPLGRLEVVLDEGAGVGAGADVPLVGDALAVALLGAQARAGADVGELAVLFSRREGRGVIFVEIIYSLFGDNQQSSNSNSNNSSSNNSSRGSGNQVHQ